MSSSYRPSVLLSEALGVELSTDFSTYPTEWLIEICPDAYRFGILGDFVGHVLDHAMESDYTTNLLKNKLRIWGNGVGSGLIISRKMRSVVSEHYSKIHYLNLIRVEYKQCDIPPNFRFVYDWLFTSVYGRLLSPEWRIASEDLLSKLSEPYLYLFPEFGAFYEQTVAELSYVEERHLVTPR